MVLFYCQPCSEGRNHAVWSALVLQVHINALSGVNTGLIFLPIEYSLTQILTALSDLYTFQASTLTQNVTGGPVGPVTTNIYSSC